MLFNLNFVKFPSYRLSVLNDVCLRCGLRKFWQQVHKVKRSPCRLRFLSLSLFVRSSYIRKGHNGSSSFLTTHVSLKELKMQRPCVYQCRRAWHVQWETRCCAVTVWYHCQQNVLDCLPKCIVCTPVHTFDFVFHHCHSLFITVSFQCNSRIFLVYNCMKCIFWWFKRTSASL